MHENKNETNKNENKTTKCLKTHWPEEINIAELYNRPDHQHARNSVQLLKWANSTLILSTDHHHYFIIVIIIPAQTPPRSSISDWDKTMP